MNWWSYGSNEDQSINQSIVNLVTLTVLVIKLIQEGYLTNKDFETDNFLYFDMETPTKIWFVWFGMWIVDTRFGSISGFHMTSLKFKLGNHWSSWDFTFMMYKSSWKLVFIQIFAQNGSFGFLIDYAWISKFLHDGPFTWRAREMSC